MVAIVRNIFILLYSSNSLSEYTESKHTIDPLSPKITPTN